ncbi:MAG: tetratricopeptide repeat protein [Planctomycetaceae bacterium]|nr:tetratricopeptide repeat protein [Planctomycetaceae bacterium]
MSSARAAALLGLLAIGGCWPAAIDPPPEEVAIDRFAKGEKLFAAGHYTDAAIEYEYAIKHRWRWKEPYVRLAACHEKSGREDDAIAVYQRLQKIDGDDPAALRGLGQIHARRGDAARALDFYRKLKTLQPDDRALDGEIQRLEALRKP